jgi:hypothetical protein
VLNCPQATRGSRGHPFSKEGDPRAPRATSHALMDGVTCTLGRQSTRCSTSSNGGDPRAREAIHALRRRSSTHSVTTTSPCRTSAQQSSLATCSVFNTVSFVHLYAIYPRPLRTIYCTFSPRLSRISPLPPPIPPSLPPPLREREREKERERERENPPTEHPPSISPSAISAKASLASKTTSIRHPLPVRERERAH